MSETPPNTSPSNEGQEPWDRRLYPRYGALEYHAWLAWTDQEEDHRVPVRLIDISRGGIAVESDVEPPAGLVLRFSLHGPADEESVDAEVVTVEPGRQAAHRVRLGFFEPCPDRLFWAAKDGIGIDDATWEAWEAAWSGMASVSSSS